MLKVVIALISFAAFAYPDEHLSQLFDDLGHVKAINHELKRSLPYLYNYDLVGGYFTMPSARGAESGEVSVGGAYVPPYNIWGLGVQMFNHLELSGNYRVYHGILESNFGDRGFGSDADRTANLKAILYREGDGFRYLPSFAIGLNDFYGSRRFYSFYAAMTKQIQAWNLEATLGWGKGRIQGFFGGVSWTPFWESDVVYLRDISFVAEYDANNYKSHAFEHPEGRESKWPINIGVVGNFLGFLQLKLNYLRGKEIAAGGALHLNLGETKGFFPKVDNPPYYTTPLNVEPIGSLRPQKEFAYELAKAFCKQGLDLYKAYIEPEDGGKDHLWLKILNTRYRSQDQVRDRLEHLLATLLPENIEKVTVAIEADGIPTQAYTFRSNDLALFRLGKINEYELTTLSPMLNAPPPPSEYDATTIYHRRKEPWTFTIRPRVLTFFGSVTGKFKYSVGVLSGFEGYIMDEVYYKFAVAYNAKSSLSSVGDMDIYNPSQLPNVHSDLVKYYQTNTFQLDQAYIQKAWNLNNGFFTRLSLGYYEPAYAGIAGEWLYYPVNSPFAIGIEAANIYKRSYHGIGFMTSVRQFDGDTPHYRHFIGYQYFLNLYANFKPLDLIFQANVGQFLARDIGARFELSRQYASGLQFSLWYTVTNSRDEVNGKHYNDKGIAFAIPFDFFLKKSSRTMLNYSMSAWLRDVGVIAGTGKQLFPTIQYARQK